MPDHYHLAGPTIEAGSILDVGNWGSVVRRASWLHGAAVREAALESARVVRFPSLPSRLDSIFVFPTQDEANFFRQTEQAFAFHHLYRVCLRNADAPSLVTDWRFIVPIGKFRHDWPDLYWAGTAVQASSGFVPNRNNRPPGQCREMLTLSPIRIEQRLD
jgi:hypothetical protein